MNEKVVIEITSGHHYVPSVKNGAEHTTVRFGAGTYGSCSPCDTEEDVQSAIKHCKEWIIREGDKPIVRDLRLKASLLNWMR